MTDHEREPVDTLEAPHEPVVATRSTVTTWLLVLAGPVVWITHFATVYLNAEATCASVRNRRIDYLGPTVLTRFVVVATVVAVAVIAVAAVIAWRRSNTRDEVMHRLAVILSVGSIAAVLAVGLPILWLDPC